jgi:hypothetical protein
VAIQSFDPQAYEEASAQPGHVRIARGVVALPGFSPGSVPQANSRGVTADVGPGVMSPWLPVVLAPCLLLLFGLIGWAWVRAALPSVSGYAQAGLAPAFGVAAVGLTATLVDLAGVRLAPWGGYLAVGTPLVVGFVAHLLWRKGRRGRVPRIPNEK